MSRYTRDEILSQGLDLASSPTIDRHDRPGDTIEENAYCIKWLQSALDKCHIKYPFSSDVQSVDIVLPAASTDVLLATQGNNISLYLPDDFILDVRDGVVVNFSNAKLRLKRNSFQSWLSRYNSTNTQNTTQPSIYTIRNKRINFAPLISSSLTATLWYYAMPLALDANDFANFPDEHTLIEYIRIKALEWGRAIELGTADTYLMKELARLKSAGLLQDTEYDAIPIENNQVFTEAMVDRNSWMGSSAGG